LCNYDWAVSFSDGFTKDIRENGCISAAESWERPDDDPSDCTGGYTWFVPSSFGDGKWKSGGSDYFIEAGVTGPVMNVRKEASGRHSVAGEPTYADNVYGSISAEATILCSHSSGSKASYSLRIGGKIDAENKRLISANTVDAANSWLKVIDFPRLTLPLESLCQTKDDGDCPGVARKAMYFDLAEKPVVVTFSAAGVFVNGELKISPVTTGDEKSSGSAANCYLRHLENFSITLTLTERAGCLTSCGFPNLAPYSVEVNGYKSWDFRCGRPSGTTGSNTGSGNYIYTPSSEIRNAATSLCDAIGGFYRTYAGGDLTEEYALGSGFVISNFYFSNATNTTFTSSPLAAIYGHTNRSNGARVQLDINHTVAQSTGLISWTFRASCQGKSGHRWRNVTSFYSQTAEDKKCVNDASLSCCGGPEFFHLPTPTTFSFSHTGVTVNSGGSSQVYSWTSGFIYSGQGYTELLASDFDGTHDAVIQKYTACFANCDYSTNLCCNPLP
jgi:hypothetical protein